MEEEKEKTEELQCDSSAKNAPISSETKKAKQNVLLQQLNDLQDHLQALPEGDAKNDALLECAKMKSQCKAYAEVLRFSEYLVTYKLKTEGDEFYKKLLRGQLYKIYRNNDI